MGVVVSLRPTGVEPRRTLSAVASSPARSSARPVRAARPGPAGSAPARLAPAGPSPTRPVPRQSEAPLRLTTRGRVVVVLLALLLVALPLVLGARAAQAEAPATAPQVERHVVLPGETLWQIAASIAEPGQDVRDVVGALVRLNELPDSSLLAGQTIVVPVSD